MKKYGDNLRQEYLDTRDKLKSLELKIKKQAECLIKKYPDVTDPDLPFLKVKDCNLNGISIESLINIIKAIEENYIDNTKQTKLEL